MAERSITIKFLGDASKGKQAFSEVGTAAGTLEAKVDGLGSKFGTFAGTLGGVVTGGALASLPGLLMDGAKGATEDAAAMDDLRKAVENSGGSWDDYSGAIDDAIKKGQDLAFTDGETAAALATLTDMTGSSDEALRRLGTAQDLARAKGISLQEAAKLLGKVSDENTTALRRMGVVLDDNATAQDVLNAVDKQFEGRAGTFAEGDAGKLLKSQQAAGELAETFGSFLIPAMLLAAQTAQQIGSILETYVAPAIQSVMNVVVPMVQTFASFVSEHAGPIIAALTGIGTAIVAVVLPALISWVAGMVPVIAGHVAMAAAVLAAYAPIIAIVAAVGLAAAGLYLAWEQNLFGIRDITQQVMDFIVPYLSAAWEGIKQGLDAALNAISTAWNAVWPVLQQVIETVFPIIATVVQTYIGILKAEIELALGIIQTVWNTVFPAIQAVVETVFPIIVSAAQIGMSAVQSAVETGVNAAKWAFDNVFVPIQGVVSDVFATIAGIVETVWGPAVTAIGAGVETAKGVFDSTFVPIQGVVSDVFSTIADLIASLWLGASGGVQMIISGVGTIVGAFAGIYETMVGFGRDIVQGLIDGITALYGTLEGWVKKIADLLIIDVPGFSPPYDAGYKQGERFVRGLTDGVLSATPGFTEAVGNLGGVMGGGAFAPLPGGGVIQPLQPGPGGGAVSPPLTGPGAVSPPLISPVIGDAYYIPPSGHFANPQNVGGGSNFGGYIPPSGGTGAGGGGAAGGYSAPNQSGGVSFAQAYDPNSPLQTPFHVARRQGVKTWAEFAQWVAAMQAKGYVTLVNGQPRFTDRYYTDVLGWVEYGGQLYNTQNAAQLGALKAGSGPMQSGAAGGGNANDIRKAVADGMADGWRRVQNGTRTNASLVGGS